MRKICAFLAVALLCLSAAEAQTRRVAVHAGHVLDVKSGKMLADQTILIEDGKIISTAPAAEAKVPSDAVRIELPTATVLPGLIDVHTHLTMDPKFGYERLATSVPREALIEPRMRGRRSRQGSRRCATSEHENIVTLLCAMR